MTSSALSTRDRSPSAGFWKDKKVLLTGHTGFKGSWLSAWLLELGAYVQGLALEPNTTPSMFAALGLEKRMLHADCDVRQLAAVAEIFERFTPDIVLHLAAQPLVRESYANPVDAYSTNVMGTVNVLECARQSPSVRSTVIVTTDKCYENREWLWGYRENDRLGGHEPYSSSKACAELVVQAYLSSYDPSAGIASARAGNVIGGGDWCANRLVPDATRAFSSKEILSIRSPLATRPWQHVLEPLRGYLVLAEGLVEDASQHRGAWNFGPDDE